MDRVNLLFSGKILAIGAHPDDIELACGGTLLQLKNFSATEVYTLICTDGSLKSDESLRRLEQEKANYLLGIKKGYFLNFKDGSLCHSSILVSALDSLINSIQPAVVMVHSSLDTHQDHIAVSLSTASALRRSNATLIFYPSFTTKDYHGSNFYVDITNHFKQKLDLLALFESQRNNFYMDPGFITTKAKAAGLINKCQYSEEFTLHHLSL